MRGSAVVILGLVAVLAAIWSAGCVALFAWTVASGFGVPPGEDVLVASIGALAATTQGVWR